MPAPAVRRSVWSAVLPGVLRCLIAPALTLAPLSAATVGTFDGATVSGPTMTFAADAVEIGGKRLALADCDWIEPAKPATAPVTEKRRLGVWLSDGGWLPVARIHAAEGGDVTDAVGTTGPLGELLLPLAAISGWGIDLPTGDDAKADLVVLASGPLQGRVQGIAAGKLRFESALNPQPIELPLAEVLGLRLATVGKRPTASSRILLSATLDPARPPLLLLPVAGLPLAAAPSLPTADAIGAALAASSLRVEGGRRVYLGSLKPTRCDEAGAFDVVWHWRADADLDGGPLALGGTRYQHGLSVHSRIAMTWDLGGAYVRLRAIAGIADLVAPEGDCAASLLADGKVLWSRDSVKGTDKPLPIDLDLQGARSLELRVDYGARYDIGDHFTLADAWLMKK